MQQLAQDEAGNIWVVDSSGNPVRLHQAAGAAPSQGRVFSLPQDPVEVAKDQAQLQSAQAQAARAAAEAPYVAQTAQAQAAKAQADAEKAQRDLKASQATADPAQQQRMQSLANDEVLSAINAARENLNRFGATGFGARLPDFAQTQGATDLGGSLSTIASRLTLDKLAQLKQASPTGASGLGSLTEKEGALLRDSVAGLGQTQSREQLEANLAAVEKHYRNFMALSAGQDYRDPKVAERYGIVAQPQGDQFGLANNGYRTESDPALKGVNAKIRSMIGAGASADDIVSYMNTVQPGLGDKSAGDLAAAVSFRAQNPRVPLDRYTISVENRSVPLSSTRNFINNAAQTPVGAGLIAAGDVASLGTLDNLQENPALARAGMRQIASENPTANLVGTLAGGIATGGGFEAMAGRAGTAWAPRIADVTFGALSGAGNADEGSRLGGAGWGALSGIAGGEVGRRGLGMFGRSLRGVQNEAAQTLRARGIPLTVGQIRGGAAKAREDRLSGFSGVGDRIMGQRRAGLQAFNRAAFDEGLQPIGQTTLGQVGEDGVDLARQAVSGPNGAYDRALRGVVLTPDPQFATDMGAALAAGRGVARTGPEFQSFVDNRIAPVFNANPSGQITGRQMQDVVQGLRGADFGTDAMGQLARDATVRMEGAVTDLADRQAPGAMEAFGNANTAYRNLNILSDAVGRGMNTGGLFTPAQLGTAARQNTNRFGGRIAAATPDRPFYELQRAGQDVLPSQIPDSGTAGRADAGAEGLTAMLRRGYRNAKGAMVYNELLQEPITRALLDRTPGMVRAGQAVEQRARLGGLFGRPLALAYGPLAVIPDY